MKQSGLQSHYSLILRFWKEQGQTYRFSVDDPQTGDRFGFSDLMSLFDFIEEKTKHVLYEEIGTDD